MRKLVSKFNMALMSTKSRKYVRAIDTVLQKCLGKNYEKTVGRLKYRIRYKGILDAVSISEENFSDLCWHFEEKRTGDFQPLVSIIVPNYNHAPYLRERLDSIYGQTYPHYEVLLLDDCSTDESLSVLQQYAQAHKENTRLFTNEKNCGNAFMQWNKGLKQARGELVWIAESDDYCESDFLETIVEKFRIRSMRIAFARSVFMREGVQIWTTEEYLRDLDRFRFDKPFEMTAHNMVRFGFAVHNMIPNASSCVFRNTGELRAETLELCSRMKLSGDWIFYLSVMEGGVVGYTNETTNYYRVHEESTSLKIQQTDRYYEEFAEVSRYVARHYGIGEETLSVISENLRKHYLDHRPGEPEGRADTLFPAEEILKENQKRQPRVALGCYALRTGGGETYPIYLANEMRRQALPVTLLNFQIEADDERIVKLVDRSVPLVTLQNRNDLPQVLRQLGIDILHTHQTYMDELASVFLEKFPELAKQVISLHGMYEVLPQETTDRVIAQANKTCRKFLYIADKNLEPFRRNGIPIDDRFIKLPNGIPKPQIRPLSKEQFGIGGDAFVFVLASRGLPEKGWVEAVQALAIAQEKSKKELHLFLLGEGPAQQAVEVQLVKMQGQKNGSDIRSRVHMTGVVSNVCDYFAMGDAGLLPTYYAGESFPLSVAECLSVGKPVIGTDIGEIKGQLTPEDRGAENDILAGGLITYRPQGTDPEELAREMLALSEDAEHYRKCREAAVDAGGKFQIADIVKRHYEIYRNLLRKESIC